MIVCWFSGGDVGLYCVFVLCLIVLFCTHSFDCFRCLGLVACSGLSWFRCLTVWVLFVVCSSLVFAVFQVDVWYGGFSDLWVLRMGFVCLNCVVGFVG